MDHKVNRFVFSGDVVEGSIMRHTYKENGTEKTIYLIHDMPGLITDPSEIGMPFNELKYLTQHQDTS